MRIPDQGSILRAHGLDDRRFRFSGSVSDELLLVFLVDPKGSSYIHVPTCCSLLYTKPCNPFANLLTNYPRASKQPSLQGTQEYSPNGSNSEAPKESRIYIGLNNYQHHDEVYLRYLIPIRPRISLIIEVLTVTWNGPHRIPMLLAGHEGHGLHSRRWVQLHLHLRRSRLGG